MVVQKLLATVQDFAPSIIARAAEIEAARELPSGLEILEAFARADGSTGWTVMIGNEGVLLRALLPRHRFDALYADSPDLIGAGSVTPRGEAKVIDGGFEVTGRWPFASGCLHSKWLLANCVVTENGR